MKEPEDVLNEVAEENMMSIQKALTTKGVVIEAMRRYAILYHKNKKQIKVTKIFTGHLNY